MALPHPPPAAAPLALGQPPRTSGMATWSLITAILGFFCFWGLGGLLGVALGVMAKGEIERSEGRLVGSGQAMAGIALGALNIIACVVGLGVLIAVFASPGSPSSSPPPAPPIAAAPAVPTAPSTPRAPAMTGAVGGDTERETATVVTQIGDIVLVDLGDDARSLGQALDEQRAAARQANQTLLLWLVSGDCRPCNGVAASLPDPRMQTALKDVRLIRVDVRSFAFELDQLRVPTDKIPGFALLRQDNRPADYVNGGEWDDDIPANIAPVLGEFVRGGYKNRRHPWHGGRRDDETTL